MPSLTRVVDGFVCQRDYDNATLGRLQFWVTQLGDLELPAITEEDVARP